MGFAFVSGSPGRRSLDGVRPRADPVYGGALSAVHALSTTTGIALQGALLGFVYCLGWAFLLAWSPRYPATFERPKSTFSKSYVRSGTIGASSERSVMSSAHPAEEFRRLYQRQRRKIRLGQALMVFGIVLGLIHVIAHLAPPGQQPSGLVILQSDTRPLPC